MSDTKNVNTPDQGTVLERSAMLVKLTRKKFNHNITDKELGARFRKELQVKKGTNAVRVQKSIIPKEATKGYKGIQNDAGQYFYSVTIPWDDKSWRLLPVVKYKEFVNRFRYFQSRFTEEVDKFVSEIDKHIKDGKEMLGLAYNENDYISRESVRGEFLLKVEYNELRAGNDFRAHVTEEEREEIAAIIQEQNETKFAKAQESVFHRVYTVAYKLAEKMGETPMNGRESPEFRDSLIGNINALVDILPALNVAGNDDLTLLTDTLKTSLGTVDPQDLRECKRLREDTKAKAEDVMSRAAAFMGDLPTEPK